LPRGKGEGKEKITRACVAGLQHQACNEAVEGGEGKDAVDDKSLTMLDAPSVDPRKMISRLMILKRREKEKARDYRGRR